MKHRVLAAMALAFAYVPLAAFAAAAPAPIDWLALVQTYLLTPAAISGLCGFLAAILPQGASGVWGVVRAIVDFVAMNWGNAKNQPK
jgi:uncharacterized membrane protein